MVVFFCILNMTLCIMGYSPRRQRIRDHQIKTLKKGKTENEVFEDCLVGKNDNLLLVY